MGRQALVSYMIGKKHKNLIETVNRSKGLKPFVTSAPSTSTPTEISSNNAGPSLLLQTENIVSDPDVPSRTGNIGPSFASQPLLSAVNIPHKVQEKLDNGIFLHEKVTKAEIMWCIGAVVNHKSLRVTGNDISLLKIMCTDSVIIVKKMTLQKDKIAYTIMYGLAPFLKRNLEKDLEPVIFTKLD